MLQVYVPRYPALLQTYVVPCPLSVGAVFVCVVFVGAAFVGVAPVGVDVSTSLMSVTLASDLVAGRG